MDSRPQRPPQRVPIGILSRQNASTVQQKQLTPLNSARQSSTFIDLTSDPEQPSRREGQAWILQEPQRVSVAMEKERRAGQDLVSGEEADKASQLKSHQEVLEAAFTKEDDSYTHSAATEEQSADATDHHKIPLPPRPSRFLRVSKSQLGAELAIKSADEEKEDVPRPYRLQPPAIATRLPSAKTADFFPWTGNHPEDTLSDQVIKGGFYDSRANITSEAHTARPALWPSLKHKCGLQALSALFVAVLDKRQELGRITAPSTFKPPPRVSLIDTKREAWLRDLANPSVPLRRLSRTIPHGIRGKVLMEQCMSKNIPIARAIWLAKCVGANEIRAFKRKGVSGTFAMNGEAKWVRDWTVFVEQFVENTIAMCGQPDWKAKMGYATRLSANFYSEHLLDQDHYLEWLLTSLEACDTERMPIWLLLVQICWKDMVANLRSGRRLVEGLLHQLHTVSSKPESDFYRLVVERLQQLVIKLAVSHRGCLIIPNTWDTYRHLFESIQSGGIQDKNQRVAGAAHDVLRRNQRLSCRSDRRHILSPGTALYAILDAAQPGVSTEELSAVCLGTIADRQELIDHVLMWATSCYREGDFRLYLVAKLLRQWNRSGLETDDAILAFIQRSPGRPGVSKAKLYHIIAELIRSDQFSVGKYLQWLIVTGALNRVNLTLIHSSPSGSLPMQAFQWQHLPCDVGLIAQMPLHGQSDCVVNLRRTLLQTIGLSVGAESQSVAATKHAIQRQLPGVFGPCPFTSGEDGRITSTSLKDLPLTVKSEISRLIREHVGKYIAGYESSDVSETPCQNLATSAALSKNGGYTVANERELTSVTVEEYHEIREMLEQLGDFPVLADVLGMMSNSFDSDVLASVADTLSIYADTFAAIGALSPLFKKIVESYRAVRITRPPDHTFLLAAIDLAMKVPTEQGMAHALRRDFARCNARASVAAFSPMSDNMAEVLQTSKDSFIEDMEQVLASSASLDKHILARLFEIITGRMQACDDSTFEHLQSMCSLLGRLRAFDDEWFDHLMGNWMGQVLLSADRTLLMRILPALVVSNTVTLVQFMAYAAKCVASFEDVDKNSSLARQVAIDVLAAVVPCGRQGLRSPVQHAFRFKVKQVTICADDPQRILGFLSVALTGNVACTIEQQHCLKGLLQSEQIKSILMRIVMSTLAPDDKHNSREASALISMTSSSMSGRLFRSLVDPHGSLGLSSLSVEGQIGRIFQSADYLSLPFCQLYLQYLLHSSNEADSGREMVMTSRRSALVSAVNAAIEAQSSVWPELVSVLDADIGRQIRVDAEERIFAETVRLFSGSAWDASGTSTLGKCLAVIDSVAGSIPEEGSRAIAAAINDKLGLLAAAVEKAGNAPLRTQEEVPLSTNAIQNLCSWIHAFLHLTLLHRRSFTSSTKSTATPVPSSSDQHQLNSLLTNLASILVSPYLQPYTQTTQYIFDTIAVFVEDLSDDSRSLILRALAAVSQDPRIRFLFGVTDSPDAWLYITSSTSSANHISATSSAQPNLHPHTTNSQQQPLPQRSTHTNPSAAASAPNPPKLVPYPLRRWEILPQDLPLASAGSSSAGAGGENDTSISLKLFAARRIL